MTSAWRSWRGLVVGAALSLAGGACGTAAALVNTEETSVEGHRTEAERERAAAERADARHDPAAARLDPALTTGPWHEPGAALPLDNTTPRQLAEADQRRAHARAHERAAEELERFEARECKGVPPKERAACPLLGPVIALQNLPDGVRVELAASVPLAAVVADMRCHQAFARARGFADNVSCPLYMRGIDIRRAEDGQAIEIRGPRELAREIQKRTRQEAVLAPQVRRGGACPGNCGRR